jgi:hypothetical protein
MKTFILAIFLATMAIANAAAQGYPGPQGGFYVYGPDHEYHLLSGNQPFMTLRPYCSPQFDPNCAMLPPPGYPLQPLRPIALPPRAVPPVAVPPRAVPPVAGAGPPALDPTPGPPLSMEQSREAVIRAGEEHCRRFADPQVCHEKK